MSENQTMENFRTTVIKPSPDCPSCQHLEKMVYMYEKLIKLLKAKINRGSSSFSKTSLGMTKEGATTRPLSENKNYYNQSTSQFMDIVGKEKVRMEESQVTPFVKTISTNISENSKVISRSNTYLKQIKDQSQKIQMKENRINQLTNDILTLKSNVLSLRNVVYQFFRLTPLPKLSLASLQTLKLIKNMFEYSQEEEEVMFKGKDISLPIKSKQQCIIDGNKDIYIPKLNKTLQVP